MPSSNPMIQQGTLNRLRGSINIVGIPALNVTAPYLGKEGITLSLEGESTAYIQTMTGAVPSPEPYMVATVEFELLKTQGLAGTYKLQMENNTVIGDFVVTTDAATLPTYYITNGSIESVKPIKVNGTEVGFSISLKGFYVINAAQWAA